MKNINKLLIPVLSILGLIFFFPIFMAIINSFKTETQMFNSVMAFPKELILSNYTEACRRMNFLRSFFNTSIVTVVGGSGIIIAGSMAAYKMNRSPGRLSTFFLYLFVSSMLIPFQSIMIPLVRLAKSIGVKNSLWGLGIICIGLGVNMAVFFIHGFVKTIPKEMDESAYIDGCSEIRLFGNIIFPLLKPIIVTIAILDFLWLWNDFLLPLVMLSSNKHYTLVLATNAFFGKYNNEWSYILAGLIMTSIPVVIFYLIFQKYIVEGITAGSVKG